MGKYSDHQNYQSTDESLEPQRLVVGTVRFLKTPLPLPLPLAHPPTPPKKKKMVHSIHGGTSVPEDTESLRDNRVAPASEREKSMGLLRSTQGYEFDLG